MVLGKIKDKIIGKIKSWFHPGIYLVDVPEDKVDAALRQENIRLKAEIAKLRAEIRELKKERNVKKEEEKIIKEAKKKEEIETIKKLRSRVILVPYIYDERGRLTQAKLKVRFLNNTRTVESNAIVMEDTDDGYSVFTWGVRRGDSILPLKKWFPDFYSMFKNNINIAKQIVSGIVDTPLDITKNGNIVLKLFKIEAPEPEPEPEPEPKKKKKNKKKEGNPNPGIPLSEQERKEYEDVIATLQQKISGLREELRREKEKVVKLQSKIADLELAEHAANRMAIDANSRLVQLVEQAMKMQELVTGALTLLSEAKIDSVLHQKEKMALIAELEAVREQLGKLRVLGQERVAKEAAYEEIERALDIAAKSGRSTTAQFTETIEALRGLGIKKKEKEEKGGEG